MFAGFDLQRHRTFTPGSSSVQIDIRTVRQALQDGLAYDTKANDEIALGIRPDHLLFYSQNAQELHRAGGDAIALRLLHRASNLEVIPQAELTPLPQDRERVVAEVSRLARSTNFRNQVLQAYGYRCAVTRSQLRLVEAAHVLPVASGPESLDVIRNGIALSPTYHRAFDRGLIYLDTGLNMRLNQDQARYLREIDQGGGLATFQDSLGRIHLPADRTQWPSRHFIRLANQHRNVA
jgi:putative restriction endonuclease